MEYSSLDIKGDGKMEVKDDGSDFPGESWTWGRFDSKGNVAMKSLEEDKACTC